MCDRDSELTGLPAMLLLYYSKGRRPVSIEASGPGSEGDRPSSWIFVKRREQQVLRVKK